MLLLFGLRASREYLNELYGSKNVGQALGGPVIKRECMYIAVVWAKSVFWDTVVCCVLTVSDFSRYRCQPSHIAEWLCLLQVVESVLDEGESTIRCCKDASNFSIVC